MGFAMEATSKTQEELLRELERERVVSELLGNLSNGGQARRDNRHKAENLKAIIEQIRNQATAKRRRNELLKTADLKADLTRELTYLDNSSAARFQRCMSWPTRLASRSTSPSI